MKGLQIFWKKNTFGSINFLTNREFIEIDESKFNNLIKKTESENILVIGNSIKVIKKLRLFDDLLDSNFKIIEANNDSELISSVFAFSPETDLNENMINISSALHENISIILSDSDIENLEENDRLKGLGNRFITILSHEDKPKSSLKIQNYLEENFELDGIEIITHSSSEYDFIVSVE